MDVRKLVSLGILVQFAMLLCCIGGMTWWLSGQGISDGTLSSQSVVNAGLFSVIFFISASGIIWRLVANKIHTAVVLIQEYAKESMLTDKVLKTDCSQFGSGDIHEMAKAIEMTTTVLKDRLVFANGVLEAISDAYPFMTVDNDGIINMMGKRLMEVSGKTGKPEDYHGMTIGGFVYGESDRKTRTDRVLIDGIKIEGETFIEGFGKTHTLAFSADPIKDSSGNQLGALTIYFDLTTIREQEQQIKRHSEQISSVAEQAITIAEHVAHSAQIIAMQVKEASEGAKVQSERAQETSTAMEQMNITSMEVARHAADAADNAAKARKQAQAGQSEVTDLIGSIESVHREANNLSGFMDKLGEQTQSVGSVINVIQDIADQTNLLALNAAIEAARAGEAGRGFAVVADEVRKLAEKTMEATDEVGAAIKAIQQGAEQSIEGVHHANEAVAQSTTIAQNSGATLNSIVNIVIGTADQVQSIAAAAEEQSATSDQVSHAIEDVTAVATNTAQGMGEANVASALLAGQASELQELIEKLHAMDNR